jgi:hypothetical protein
MKTPPFFQQVFDKLVLVFLSLVVLGLIVIPSPAGHDPETVAVLRTLVGTVTGALITLITGAALRSGAPPSPPPGPNAPPTA